MDDDVEKLLKVLEPFTEYGETLLGQKARDDRIMIELWDHKITVGDFRELARTVQDMKEKE